MFHDIDQNSPDWLQMRCACATASHVWQIMKKLKDPKKEAAERIKYRKQKIQEQLTGLTANSFVSPYMEAGLEEEPLARRAYAISMGVEVLHGGLYEHDTIPRFMASPDGRVDEDGLIEIKYLTGTTTEANHLDLLLGEEIPYEYILQTQAQLSCSGRKWVDIVSFDGRMPPNLRLFVKRFERDEKLISAIELEVIQFLSEVVEQLQKLGERLPTAQEIEDSVADAKGIIP